DVLVGELADRVAREHGGDAVRRALPRDRAAEVRLLADDEDKVVVARAERDVDARGAVGGDADRGTALVRARVDGAERVAARGHVREAEAAVRTRRRAAAKLDELHLRALQPADAACVDDAADKRAGKGGGGK